MKWKEKGFPNNVTRQCLKHTVYERKVDVDMLNAIKSVLADVSSISPSSEQSSVYAD